MLPISRRLMYVPSCIQLPNYFLPPIFLATSASVVFGRACSVSEHLAMPAAWWGLAVWGQVKAGPAGLAPHEIGWGNWKGAHKPGLRAFGHTEKGKWVEGASQLELGAGSLGKRFVSEVSWSNHTPERERYCTSKSLLEALQAHFLSRQTKPKHPPPG